MPTEEAEEETTEAVSTEATEQRMIKAVKAAVKEEIKASRPNIEVKAKKFSFAQCVKDISDARRFGKQVNWNSEATNADGASLLPVDISKEVCAATFESQILSRVKRVPISGQVLRIPWRNYGAIVGRAITAAQQGTEKTDDKVQFSQQNITLENIYALTPCSDELLEDIPQIASQIQTDHSSAIQNWLEDGIINGTGASFTGISGNAVSTIPVARTTGGNVTRQDFANLYSRLWRSGGLNDSSVVFLISPSVFAEIEDFRDANSISIDGKPQTMIYGYPVIMTPWCSALGTQGDVILADLSKFVLGVKSSGLNFDVSPHVYFNYDMTTFRSTMRMAGAPCQQAVITSNGQTYAFMAELADSGTQS